MSRCAERNGLKLTSLGERVSFEVIIPVENAENLVKVLQDMITEIRARQTQAA